MQAPCKCDCMSALSIEFLGVISMNRRIVKKLLPLNCVVLIIMLALSVFLSKAATQVNQTLPIDTGNIIIIDPGHGIPDGGATSCTGVLEADLNLEIGLRLTDLCNFLGIQTVMTRTNRDSIYTEGESISKKKISDTKNRVSLINSIQNGILLSIHQNHFYDSRYSGAQVFYAETKNSDKLAKKLQGDLVAQLNPGSNRKAKKSSGVYIMDHIQCTGVLIECGFLSNIQEECYLRSPEYQKKLCSVVATSCQTYMDQKPVS